MTQHLWYHTSITNVFVIVKHILEVEYIPFIYVFHSKVFQYEMNKKQDKVNYAVSEKENGVKVRQH